MNRHRESFTQEQFESRMEYGHEVLSNYYDKYINTWNKIVAIERNIRNIVVNEVPLRGKLDKLEFDGRSVNIVDYKTGDPDKAKSKLQPPSDKDPVGGDYWRQAVFYKILVDNYEKKGWKVVSTEFDFIEPDKKKTTERKKSLLHSAILIRLPSRSKRFGKRYKTMIFIRDVAKKIATGAILLKPITLQLLYMKWKKSQNHDL